MIRFSLRHLFIVVAIFFLSGVCYAGIAAAAPNLQVEIQVSKQLVRLGSGQYWVHTVRRGETLYSIAKAYNVSQERIVARNPFVSNGLNVKQTLLIPIIQSSSSTANSTANSTSNAASNSTSNATSNSVSNSKDTPTRDSNYSNESDTQQDEAGPIASQDTIIEEVVVDPRYRYERTENRMLAPFNDDVIDIAIILPMNSVGISQQQSGAAGRQSQSSQSSQQNQQNQQNQSNENFADFYRGTLIALSSLREQGINTRTSVISSQHGIDTTALRGAELIIGPVYEYEAAPVVQFATDNRIAMVSPLAEFKDLSSPFLFQAAPERQYKWGKLKSMLDADTANIVVIRDAADTVEQDMLEAIAEYPCQVINYSRSTTPRELTSTFTLGGTNIVIIPIDNQAVVEQVLSRISSLNTTNRYDISVIGNSSWAKFHNINMDLYFKLSLKYITSYHADRGNDAVAQFYNQYITAFACLPNLFSFRGYDVVKYFVNSLNEYNTRMPLMVSRISGNDELLQVGYNFQQASPSDSHKNQEWVMVSYKPNYQIEVR